ncbi:heme peroxidase [Rhizoctonia solani]|uniref:linoleate 8R-lipoxygenase n=1 Tax=Rhizoctonia solani TaxID=456999 RepID=A0A8H7LIZ5_9AGAM|nr:heme peroxidase [Rhizoctonia solani]
MPSLWNPVLDTLAKVSDLADTSRLSSRPIPKAPDGLSDAQAAPAMFGRTDRRSTISTVIDAFTNQARRGKPVDIDFDVASAAADALLNSKTIGLDDRKYLLEYLFVALSRLSPGGDLQQKLQDAVITLLYGDLPHPPVTNVHPDSRFREPDGGNNNLNMPDLGRAGTPYSRTVASITPIPPTNLPTPELIFDTLLRRDTEGGIPHPAGVSSLLFSFAVLIIHSLFRTSPESVYINDTSSYLDLSPLYGHSFEAQNKVRRNDGTGRLHEDVFAENRLLLMPPAVSALLVMFCRNHNYIATKLLQINENRTFKDPEKLKDLPVVNPEKTGTWGGPSESGSPQDQGNNAGGGKHGKDWTDVSMTDSILSQGATASTAYTTPAASRFLGLDNQASRKPRTPLEEQDHVIFNTARLINCGFFMHIIISDYIGAILGLTREGSSYSLNPLEDIRGSDHKLVGRGEGNSCSVEFNLLYRWHATLSAADEKWTESMMKSKFGDVDPSSITLEDFMKQAAKDKKTAQTDVKTWTFHNKHGQPLQRDSTTGRFKDADLAELLHDAVENVSGAFSARNTPEVLKIVEVLGINQARKWGVCTLNEFRKFIGLKPYESFEEWNPRQEIADAARGLYGHPDNLELYVGMQAEEAKPVIAGAGLCPGYTISRAILADAVALTRGDRFLTTDFTPQNLTVWGFQDCQRDINNGCFGGVLSKILMRGLPEHYTFNSVYALFPFMTPKFMKTHLEEMGIIDLYDLRRPEEARHIVGINSYKAVREVLNNPAIYNATYEKHMKELTNGYGFFLAMDDPAAHQRDMNVMHKVMVGSAESLEYNVAWYAAKTTELIKDKSFSMSKGTTRNVDIVRDVLNLVPVYWVSQEMAGLPLKCKGNEDGLITEQEIYQMMTVVFTHIFLNVEPLNGWQLRDKAKQVASKLLGIIQGHLEAIASKGRLSFAGIKAFVTDRFYGDDDRAQAFLANLYKNRGDLTIEQLSYNVFGCMIASVSNYAQAATQVVDFYLEDSRQDLKEIICELSRQNTPESDHKLAGYVREAMREYHSRGALIEAINWVSTGCIGLSPQAPGIFRDVSTEVTLQDGDKTLHLTPHNRLFVSLANSNLDPDAFENPHSVNPDRPRDAYNLFGHGMHKCMGDQFTERTMPAVIKSIFKLKNIRRAPGESGKLRSFTQDLHGTKQTMFINARGLVTPWPASMVIQYDE